MVRSTWIVLLALVASGCGFGGASLPHHIDAKDNVAVFPDGTRVELYMLDQGHSNIPGACWTPAGAPLPKTQESVGEPLPTAAERVGRRMRRLFFHVTNRPPDSYVECYVPDGAPSGLSLSEKREHGWQIGGWPGAVDYGHEASVYVEQSRASRFLFGIASGEYRSLGTFPNTFRTGGLADGQEVLSGKSWKVVAHPPRAGFAESKFAMEVRLETVPTNGTYDTEFNLQAYDYSGKVIGRGAGGDAAVFGLDLHSVDHFELLARPIQYALFSGIHYDPVGS